MLSKHYKFWRYPIIDNFKKLVNGICLSKKVSSFGICDVFSIPNPYISVVLKCYLQTKYGKTIICRRKSNYIFITQYLLNNAYFFAILIANP